MVSPKIVKIEGGRSLKKYLNDLLSVVIAITSIGSFFMKTTMGQIIVGAGCLILVFTANVIHIRKKEEPIRWIIYFNIMFVLFILCIISNVLFKSDITLYLAIASLLFVVSFEIFELALRIKKVKK
jgi:Ca2+/Na+ antiporter